MKKYWGGIWIKIIRKIYVVIIMYLKTLKHLNHFSFIQSKTRLELEHWNKNSFQIKTSSSNPRRKLCSKDNLKPTSQDKLTWNFKQRTYYLSKGTYKDRYVFKTCHVVTNCFIFTSELRIQREVDGIEILTFIKLRSTVSLENYV